MKAVCIKNASIGEIINYVQLNIYEITFEGRNSFTIKDKDDFQYHIAKPGHEKYPEDPYWINFVDHFRMIAE